MLLIDAKELKAHIPVEYEPMVDQTHKQGTYHVRVTRHGIHYLLKGDTKYILTILKVLPSNKLKTVRLHYHMNRIPKFLEHLPKP